MIAAAHGFMQTYRTLESLGAQIMPQEELPAAVETELPDKNAPLKLRGCSSFTLGRDPFETCEM